MKKILVMAITLMHLAPSMVFADLTGTTKINKVFAGYSSGDIYFEVDDPIINPAGCTYTDRYAVDPNYADMKTFLAVLLMAEATQKNVIINISSSVCSDNRPMAMRLEYHRD